MPNELGRDRQPSPSSRACAGAQHLCCNRARSKVIIREGRAIQPTKPSGAWTTASADGLEGLVVLIWARDQQAAIGQRSVWRRDSLCTSIRTGPLGGGWSKSALAPNAREGIAVAGRDRANRKVRRAALLSRAFLTSERAQRSSGRTVGGARVFVFPRSHVGLRILSSVERLRLLGPKGKLESCSCGC